MRNHNFFVTFLKKVYLLINNLLKKYLNKLNSNNLSYLARSKKIFITFVALIILFLSYLLIPNIYNKVEIENELKNQFQDRFNLNLNFSQNLKYNFLPRPHFINKESYILKDQNKIAEIKELKIYVSLNNLFSLKDIKIKDIILANTNFNLNYQNYNFFTKLLSKNFKDNSFIIKNSNIFYRNNKNDVLFINKIKNMKYYYDFKKAKNIVASQNEIFNLPYSLELHDDKIKNIIFSKLNLKFLQLQIENEIDYTNDLKKGSANLIMKKNKSTSLYEITKKSFTFNFFDKVEAPNFLYKGNINFNPFYSNLNGKTKEINLSPLFTSDGIFSKFLKTEILNNKNLNFNLNINASKFKNYQNFLNIFLNSKIKEGLIDIDNTKFFWNDYANFKIIDSLIYVKNNEVFLDGKLDIIINNSAEIYKFLLTPKNYRTKIDKIELNFSYNFDQKILGFNGIKIDNEINHSANNHLKSLLLKENKLQNKIYLMNIINKAIKSYSG